MRVDYVTLYETWRCFRKDKRPSRALDDFAYHLEENLSCLAADLTQKSYRHGGYRSSTIQEKKRRDLAVASVRDRVVHRLLYDYLVERFDRTFDPDVWSCREGKGLHKCLERTQLLLRKHADSLVWRADITKFFDSVRHDVLLACLERKIGDDTRALWLCQEVIASYDVRAPKDRGFRPRRWQMTDGRHPMTP